MAWKPANVFLLVRGGPHNLLCYPMTPGIPKRGEGGWTDAVIHPRDVGLAFPRTMKRRKAPPRASKPEAVTQRKVEAYLALRGLYALHVPEFLLNAAFRHRNLSGAELGAAKRAADRVRGLPDLMIFDPKRPGLILSIELKTEIGRMTASQKHWQTILGTRLCRSFEAAKMEIEAWLILGR